MEVMIKVIGLSPDQWRHIQETVQASYEGAAPIVWISATFQTEDETEIREVRMPGATFWILARELARIERTAEMNATARAALDS